MDGGVLELEAILSQEVTDSLIVGADLRVELFVGSKIIPGGG